MLSPLTFKQKAFFQRATLQSKARVPKGIDIPVTGICIILSLIIMEVSYMGKYLRIGQIAKLIGMSPKTIRYYEEIGVLPRAKRSQVVHGNGYRLYTQDDVLRLEFIKRAKLLDLSLTEIRELVSTAQEGCCSSVNPELARLVEQKLGEIDQRIADLEELRKILKRLQRQFKQPLIIPEFVRQTLPIINLPCHDESCRAPKR
jgi:DNA-binding transcriptional MerR regulator